MGKELYTYQLRLAAPESEFDHTFTQGMANRMAVSYFKYGAVADAYPGRCKAVESLQLRIDRYLETGNTEYLIDAANFAMIEFMHPSVKGAHFTPTDSDGSPGRVLGDGSVSQRNNTL